MPTITTVLLRPDHYGCCDSLHFRRFTVDAYANVNARPAPRYSSRPDQCWRCYRGGGNFNAVNGNADTHVTVANVYSKAHAIAPLVTVIGIIAV